MLWSSDDAAESAAASRGDARVLLSDFSCGVPGIQGERFRRREVTGNLIVEYGLPRGRGEKMQRALYLGNIAI
jgi:hypothetical protein